MASALNTRSGERLPACAAARARHPPTPAGMSGSESSIEENLPPPPSLGRGRSIAPLRIDASGDQNSAGKYPFISRPMQISTRVGVVHDMAFFLLGCEDNTPFLKCPTAVSRKTALCLRRFGKIARRQLSVSP